MKGLHDPEEFEAIGTWLAGASVLYLQSFRESENVLEKGIAMEAFTEKELESMAQMARKSIARVEIRGVE